MRAADRITSVRWRNDPDIRDIIALRLRVDGFEVHTEEEADRALKAGAKSAFSTPRPEASW